MEETGFRTCGCTRDPRVFFRMYFIFKIFVLTVALSVGIWLAEAGDSTNFRVNVNMVQLRVTITDKEDRYIENLGANDFRIFENGVEQKISGIIQPAESEKSATTVFILFDTSDHMYDDFVFAEDTVADFIRGLAPSDAIAVYSFSRNVTRLAPPTMDRLVAMRGLRHAVVGDATSLYDSILLTLRDAAKVKGNKVIVIFSNGQDRTSMLGPEHVRRVAEDEGVPLYVVSAWDRNPLAHAAFADLADETGGRVYFAPNWQKQKLAFASIDSDLNHSYVLTYYVPQAQDEAYRNIEVRIAGDDAHHYRVRTRHGYQPAHSD